MQTHKKKCPSQEKILEFSTFPGSLSFFQKTSLKIHLFQCTHCHQKNLELLSHWQNVFQPKSETETESLLKVYSRLQKDETLILKGWKLESPRFCERASRSSISILRNPWAVGVASLMIVSVSTVSIFLSTYEKKPAQTYSLKISPRNNLQAKVKITDQNSVQTHYLEPQLIRMVEFETADQP